VARPEFRIVAPAEVIAGDTFSVDVVMKHDGDAKVEDVVLQWFGLVQTTNETQKHAQIERTRHGIEQLSGPAELPTEQRWTVRFATPEDAPPTYMSTVGIADVRYVLELHAGIPWWFDVDQELEVKVRQRPASRSAPKPKLVSSLGPQIAIELSVADVELAPGDRLTGSCAIDRTFEGMGAIELSLVGRESGRFGGEASRVVLHRIANPGNAVANAFGAYIPRNTAVAFTTRDLSLSYVLEASVETPSSPAVAYVPLVVRALEGAPARSSVPDIGHDRWLATWLSVGEAQGFDLDEERGTLSTDIDGVTVSIASEHAFLTAKLDGWPSFELGLTIEDKRLFERSLPIHHRLAKRRLVRARNTEQGLAFYRPALLDALDAFHEVTLDDEHVLVRTAADPHDEQQLAAFVSLARTLARELAQSIVQPAHGPYR
jgi:hypothetical protein